MGSSWQVCKEKVLPKINILKAVSGIKWGAHPGNLLTVYRGLIRPALDWGCQILTEMGHKASLVFDRLQFAALRITLGLMCSTPTVVTAITTVA